MTLLSLPSFNKNNNNNNNNNDNNRMRPNSSISKPRRSSSSWIMLTIMLLCFSGSIYAYSQQQPQKLSPRQMRSVLSGDATAGEARVEAAGDEAAGDEAAGDEAAGDEAAGDEAAGEEAAGEGAGDKLTGAIITDEGNDTASGDCAASTCEGCQPDDSSTCSWSEGKCALIPQNENTTFIACGTSADPNEDVTEDSSANTQQLPDEGNDADTNSTRTIAMFFGFCLVGFVIRKKVLERTTSNYSASSPSNNNTRMGSGSNMLFGSRTKNPEHVPLSSAGSDEWDWDDGEMGDVELSKTKSKEDDDLEMALALSLSVTKSTKKANESVTPVSMMAPTPPTHDSWDDDSGWEEEEVVDTTTAINNNNHNTSGDQDTTRWGTTSPQQQPATNLNENDIQSLLRETKASHVPTNSQITSLGPAKPKKKTAPPVPKTAEEDIFATMGFSSSYNGTQPTNSAPTSWNNQTSITATSMLAAEEGSEEGSKWDDDSDLDDLLDE